jgi:uncharacterized protein (UPF0276 family)
MSTMHDRFGLTWHPELAPDILRARHAIDMLEVIPEVVWHGTANGRDFLRLLSREFPVSLHGVSLGLASTSPVDDWRLEEMARLVEEVQPESWSEHLAFVRAGGIELGHLAAPPRSDAVIEGLAANVRRARRLIGDTPALENVATLLNPPGSTRDELTWLCDVLRATGAPLLLDLHNVCTNAVNLGYDARAFVRALPLACISTVHIAGGVDTTDTVTGRTLRVDDHRHDVPPNVFELLTLVGERAPQPLTVVLEREGAFPPFARLLEELARAREALAAGRREAADARRSTELPGARVQ